MEVQFCSSEAELLGANLAFAIGRSLLRVRRGCCLHEAGLVVNKGTQSKTGCAPYFHLLD